MKRMKKVFCALLAMVLVAGVCVIPTEARSDYPHVKVVQEAIDNAENGATISLTENLLWDDGEPIEIPAGKNIILNLNGYTLESLDIYPVLKVETGAQLKVINGDVKQFELAEGTQLDSDAGIGLFEVQENAKITIQANCTVGYNAFTSDSTGEIVLMEGTYFSKIPNVKYELSQWATAYSYSNQLYVEDIRDAFFSRIEMQHLVSNDYLERNEPIADVEQEFLCTFRNNSGEQVEIKELKIGYTLSDNKDSECVFFEPVDSNKNISIDANSGVDVKFKGMLPSEMVGKDFYLTTKASVTKDGVNIIEYERYANASAYKSTVDMQGFADATEVSKPVDYITAVKNTEEKHKVEIEVSKIVGESSCCEVPVGVTEEIATKVGEAIWSGKTVNAKLTTTEMSQEEVNQLEEANKQEVENVAIEALGKRVTLQYFSIKLLLNDGTENLGEISNIGEEITFQLVLPEKMKTTGSNYQVIRIVEGKAEALDTTWNTDGMISFKTDCFSIYALAYIGKVNVVEDTKTEETVKKETENVVEQIVAGTVADSVVDEKTAEKVVEAVNSGKSVSAEIVVVKVPESEIAQIEQTAIEEKVTAELGEDAKVQYLDVSVVLMAGNEELGTLNELQEEITITVAIPEELKADGRTYKVIRNHDGVVEVLDTVVNEDGTISFKTDRFSTYAIAYADKEETNTNPNPGAPSTDNNKDTNTNTNINQSNKTPSTDTKAPQTGDNNSVMVYVAICFVAMAAVVVTKKRNAFVK